MVDAKDAAAMCGISSATWYRHKAAGKTPAPVKLGGRVLYRVEDLTLWVALGCPDRKTFEARKAAGNANGRSR
jgi:predicted DNA-binding transcriptional regulator AlpA